jgi:hypothetical protein
MAKRKIAELDELMARVAHRKLILDASFQCECRQLEDCERLVAAKIRCRSNPSPQKVCVSNDPLRRLRSKP